MHSSLIPDRAAALDTPLPAPPTPIFDIHMHADGSAATTDYVRTARAFGVERAVNLGFSGIPDAMRDRFGEFFLPCAWARINNNPHDGQDWAAFRRDWIDGFDRLLEHGIRFLKFKMAPEKGRPQIVRFDDERVAPLLEKCARHGIIIQGHMAHPAAWWPKPFDPAVTGPREIYLDQVPNALANHPELVYLGVHMGNCPEDLPYLASLMERFPNYYIDTSATKWTVRELSAKPTEAKAFFLRYADRICFATDLVVQEQVDSTYYTSRFHVQRTMWETDVRTGSMIADPDAPAAGPHLNGLHLPADVLRKLYWENAHRLIDQSRSKNP